MSSPRQGLKIALVSAFPPGRQSLNEYGLHLANGFAARADVDEVIVIADRLDTPVVELDLGPKIRVCRTWKFNSPAAALSISAALAREGADCALFNLQTASFGDWELPAALGLFAPMMARFSGTPTGVLAHNIIGGIDLESTQLRGQYVRQALTRFAGAIITRSLLLANYVSVTLDSYQKLLNDTKPCANVALIPHGTFDTAEREPMPNAERPMRIVTMGKFGTYKRLETLLAAFKKLKETGHYADLELVIGGTDHPSTPGYLDDLASRHADDTNITFAGYLEEEEIPDFFGTARVSVFDYESTTGSSGVLHQTASYGAVPVFPKIGDFVDVCRDEGLGGINYKPGDVEGMATAIDSVMRDPLLADSIAEANRSASMDMPFADVIDRHIVLLRDAMDRRVAAAQDIADVARS